MNDPNPPAPDPSPVSPFDAFSDLARQLLAVPKPEIDRAESEYQKSRGGQLKRGPKPRPKAG